MIPGSSAAEQRHDTQKAAGSTPALGTTPHQESPSLGRKSAGFTPGSPAKGRKAESNEGRWVSGEGETFPMRAHAGARCEEAA